MKRSVGGLNVRAHLKVILGLSMLAGAAEARAATTLELLGGRFQVSAQWRTADGASGAGQAIQYSAETGMFWFFSPANLELVVKVLDACAPPFERFWVFASGLTHTDVTLTVVDTWSGRTESYHHPGGTLFVPLADTASFDTCALSTPPCGSGNRADIQASPRPDASAEHLALLLGAGVAAEQALYQRLSTELAAIRAAEPALADARFNNIWWNPHNLLVGLTPEAHAAVKAGTYHEWDCLNSWFGGTVEQVFDIITWAVLRFTPLLHPYRMGADYAALPAVTHVEANHYGYPPGLPSPTPGLCAIADGAAFDYFFESNPWRYFRVASPGATPVLVDQWNGLTPAPSWKERLDECYARLDAAALPVL